MAAPYLVADFASRFEPDPITVERAFDEPDATIRGFEEEPRRFGFSWFIPALARHRGIWRDVLLASLAIQVIGLTTPLLTQVTIDKRDGERHRRPAERRRDRGTKPQHAIERARRT